MKSNKNNSRFGFKAALCGGLLAISLSGFAQQRSVILDPKLDQIAMTDLIGTTINENFIQPGQSLKIVIPVASVNQQAAMPKGSCKIKIGLGSKLSLDPTFDLNTAALGNYFTWTSTNTGGQVQITGELTSALPANFQQVEVGFKVIGNQVGHSTVTANFLITNHNTVTVLSDRDGANNSSYLKYNVTSATAPLPVTTLNDVVKTDCSFKAKFSTDREINLTKYEVEVSKNNVDFVKVNEANATNLAEYLSNVELSKEMQSQILYVRVKSIYSTGRIAYSNTKTIAGLCGDGKWMVDMYPNPTKGNSDVVIRALEGTFNNEYTITMLDMAGRTIQVSQIKLNNVVNFKYRIGDVTSGKYMLKIVSANGNESVLLRFEKM